MKPENEGPPEGKSTIIFQDGESAQLVITWSTESPNRPHWFERGYQSHQEMRGILVPPKSWSELSWVETVICGFHSSNSVSMGKPSHSNRI